MHSLVANELEQCLKQWRSLRCRSPTDGCQRVVEQLMLMRGEDKQGANYGMSMLPLQYLGTQDMPQAAAQSI